VADWKTLWRNVGTHGAAITRRLVRSGRPVV
jgi:hypothetical protein